MPAVISGLVLARAQSLAHNGQLTAAENVLRSLLDSTQSRLPALDLLARIRAQQGRYQDAAELWGTVIQSDPSNAEAQSACSTALGMTRWRQLARPVAAGATGVILLVVAGAWWNSHRSPAEAPSISVSRRSSPGVATAALQTGFVNLLGWDQEKTEDGIRLVPQSSLFGAGTSLTNDGRGALDAIANHIRGLHSIEIEIRGTTDTVPLRPGSPYRDNEELRTLRAALVADYISRTGAAASNKIVIRPERMSPRDTTTRAQLLPKGLRGVILFVKRSSVE